jgi:TPR repeat protein
MEPPKYIPSAALDAFQRQDYELVLKLALPAAMDGNSDAQTTVALLYQCGLGVNRNMLEAERQKGENSDQTAALPRGLRVHRFPVHRVGPGQKS